MSWHIFPVCTESSDDGADTPECRIDSDLQDLLVEREMWDRTVEELVKIVFRLLERKDGKMVSEEFEVFDLFDESILMAVRYSQSAEIWELYETFRDSESLIEEGDAEDERPM